MHVALRLAKWVEEGDNDYDDEGGLEESQKTEDTIGIYRNETRSTGSAAWEERSKPRDMRYTNIIHKKDSGKCRCVRPEGTCVGVTV